MIQDTIQAVKDAELKAEQLVKEAAENGRSLVEEALKEAEVMKEQISRETKADLAAHLETLKKEGEDYMEKALGEASKDTDILREKAAQNESRAIQAVVMELM